MSPCKRTARQVKDKRGFTLLEVLIVVVLFGLLMGTVQETVVVGLRQVSAADKREEIRQRLTSALDRLTREISMADNVNAAQSGRFQFDTPSVNNVDYVYDSSAGTLSRDDASSPLAVIVRNVTSLDFNYFDASGAQLSEPVAGASEDTIRLVQVAATVTKDSEAITVASAAFLRNMT